MGQPHGRVGGVHALAAGARGAVHVHAHVGGVQVHLDVVGDDRQHLHGGEGGLAALLGIGGRNAHEAVDADLAAQHAVGVAALDLDRGTVEPDTLAGHQIEHRDLPALVLGVMDVHLVEHLGPVLGLETPLTRVHRQDGIALVELPGEPGLDLQLIEQGGQLGGSLGGLLGEGPVVAGQLAGGRGIVGQGTGPLVIDDGGPQARGPLAHGLGRRRVVPEVRRRRLLV